MQLRLSNLAPTVLVSVACLLPAISIYLLLNGPLRGLTFMQMIGVHAAIAVVAVLVAIAGLVAQVLQPRQAEGASLQRATWASTGLLFTLCLVIVAIEVVILGGVLLIYMMLRMLSGGAI